MCNLCTKLCFHIPAHLAGYPVFGFGLLLALWAVVSVGTLAWLAWRQGFNADTWGYVPILGLIGAIIAWLLPAICLKTAEWRAAGIAHPQLRRDDAAGRGRRHLAGDVAGQAGRARSRSDYHAHLLDAHSRHHRRQSVLRHRILAGLLAARLPRPRRRLAALLGSIVNVAKGGLVVYGSFIGGV